jgi:uncharacterized alkaline shock family protein YloU
MADTQPLPPVNAVAEAQPREPQAEPPGSAGQGAEVARLGRGELGSITITDQVVTKIAACAAAEHPDAGAAATRMLGHAVPGAGHLGVRGTDLGALPSTSVKVDGSKAFVTMEISIRWPAPVLEVTEQIRRLVQDRVAELTGLQVDEVHIVVSDLATDLTLPPRVR